MKDERQTPQIPDPRREPDESLDVELAGFVLEMAAGESGAVEAVTAAHADEVLARHEGRR